MDLQLLFAPLWPFALLVLGIVVLPGMDMAFVAASALVDGRRAGLAAVAGLVIGGALHMALAAAGLGLLLRAAPAAFNALLLAGAGYVAWMGWCLLRRPGALLQLETGRSRSRLRTLLRATATCLMNPKAYVFMLAVLPQFLRAERGALLPQVLAMGAIVAATQAAVYGAVALGAAGLRARLQRSAAAQQGAARAVGALLLATAAWTLAGGWRP
jgi:threonine/homoserine/homoserine lactone efflux protein